MARSVGPERSARRRPREPWSRALEARQLSSEDAAFEAVVAEATKAVALCGGPKGAGWKDGKPKKSRARRKTPTMQPRGDMHVTRL